LWFVIPISCYFFFSLCASPPLRLCVKTSILSPKAIVLTLLFFFSLCASPPLR
jgi:hypothetical protein